MSKNRKPTADDPFPLDPVEEQREREARQQRELEERDREREAARLISPCGFSVEYVEELRKRADSDPYIRRILTLYDSFRQRGLTMLTAANITIQAIRCGFKEREV